MCVDQKTDSFLIVLDEPAIDIFVGIRAEQFDVTLPFLLQQAAWLYEQQLSQVKAQLRKATRPASIGNSPTPGSASGSGIAGGHAMIRGGSGGKPVRLLNDPIKFNASRLSSTFIAVESSARSASVPRRC